MGSGSRIDHQSHAIAPTAMPAAPGHGVDPTDAEQARRARAAVAVGLPYRPPSDTAAAVSPAVARAAARDALAEVAAESEASRLAQAAAQRDDEPGYSHDVEAFQRDYDAAIQRIAAGEAPVPYMREDATGGLGARDGGRGFGVELEFELPSTMTNWEKVMARAAIAEDLYEAGLSRDEGMHAYHHADDEGYTDDPGAWTFEMDDTVNGGEIVSPIMYDTPETWANLEQVCQIIARHGGIASVNTGGHVHVGAGDYDHTVANHSRLMTTVAAYEDVLYRLSQNPGNVRHRGTLYCRPNDVPSDGYYRDVADARNDNTSHGLALNLQSMYGDVSDHVEFRMFDGSLNPAVIQTQIKVALGTVHAALRQARDPEPPAGGARHWLGSHIEQFGADQQAGSRWHQATAAFRTFADMAFSRSADRAQAASLFAATGWQQAY